MGSWGRLIGWKTIWVDELILDIKSAHRSDSGRSIHIVYFSKNTNKAMQKYYITSKI